MSRTPNTECAECKVAVYKRPRDLKERNYCSRQCWGFAQRVERSCEVCLSIIDSSKDGKTKTCSDECYKKLFAQRLEGRLRTKYGDIPKSSAAVKRWLIRKNGHRCERCQLSEWQGELIKLTLEHIDGDNKNNSIENLAILCWNCHALTKTFCVPKSPAASKITVS